MFEKKWLVIVLVFSLALFLFGCDLFGDTEVDVSEDFYGLALGAQWVYNEEFIGVPGEGTEVAATLTRTVMDVVDVEMLSENQFFYLENAWEYDEEDWERWSFGSIIEQDNSAYYRAGFWDYDNGTIISDIFEEREFLLEEEMSIGENGFWNLELLRKDERVTVPAGVFDTWYFKRTCEDAFDRVIEEIWVAPYIGIVKEKYRHEGLEDGDWVVFEGVLIELLEFNP